jgi:hypothetical protein
MAAYLATTPAERLVVVDAPGSPFELPDIGRVYANTAGILDALQSQTRFVPLAADAVPEHGATVTVWRREAR